MRSDPDPGRHSRVGFDGGWIRIRFFLMAGSRAGFSRGSEPDPGQLQPNPKPQKENLTLKS